MILNQLQIVSCQYNILDIFMQRILLIEISNLAVSSSIVWCSMILHNCPALHVHIRDGIYVLSDWPQKERYLKVTNTDNQYTFRSAHSACTNICDLYVDVVKDRQLTIQIANICK